MKQNKRLILSHPPDPDSHPELIIDRGKHNDGVGSWVHGEKHKLLATYIDAARAAATSGKFNHWVFIDPFCGPGRMQSRGESFTRPGGAMVAWRQSQISGAPFSKVFVGDLDKQRVAACASRLSAASCPVQAFHGPAAETAIEMVRAVPPRSLCLVYIDPYNLALLSHAMIAEFAKLQKVDFVVHFSTMDWLRNVGMEMQPDRARFDEVCPGWRERLAGVSNSSLPVAFFDHWHQQIRSLGFEFSKAMKLIYNDDQHEIYKLVFFARHNLPLKLWGDVARSETRDLFN